MKEEENEKSTEIDQEIREDQWKNCVGCVVGAVVVITVIVFILFKLARS